MEIKRLNYFVRVAAEGSLTRAASVLRVAQSALSRQMRLLEDELGVPLFARTARGMRLTAEGEQLRASVAGPLREVELALHSIRSRVSTNRVKLTVGMSPALAATLGEGVVLELHARFPHISFSLADGPTGSLVDWLVRGVIDFALLEGAAENASLRERKLLSLAIMLAGARNSRPAPVRGRGIPLRDALTLPLVLPSHHLGVRALVNDAAARIGADLDMRFEADSAHLAKELARRGLAFCLLPEAFLRDAVARGELHGWIIDDPPLALDIYLCSRRSGQASARHFGAIEDCLAAIARSELADP